MGAMNLLWARRSDPYITSVNVAFILYKCSKTTAVTGSDNVHRSGSNVNVPYVTDMVTNWNREPSNWYDKIHFHFDFVIIELELHTGVDMTIL